MNFNTGEPNVLVEMYFYISIVFSSIKRKKRLRVLYVSARRPGLLNLKCFPGVFYKNFLLFLMNVLLYNILGQIGVESDRLIRLISESC